MTDDTLITELQEKIIEIYRKYAILNLKGPDNDYRIEGHQILSWYHKVVRKNRIKYPGAMNYFELFDDLSFCSDEIIYFTAHLFLYRPHINNPLNDVTYLNGSPIYPNHQNIASKRYSMYANVVAEKLYNYWDRIGDLIASFFPGQLNPQRVFFPTAIAAIPQQFRASENYKWLASFLHDQYKILNETRIQTVHYIGTDGKYRTAHLKVAADRAAMEQLQAERHNLPEYYNGQIQLTREGFVRAVLLLEEITAALYTDIPDILGDEARE